LFAVPPPLVLDALNQRTTYTYDDAGNVTSIEDALGAGE
jgi:YD repeat-containing protein